METTYRQFGIYRSNIFRRKNAESELRITATCVAVILFSFRPLKKHFTTQRVETSVICFT